MTMKNTTLSIPAQRLLRLSELTQITCLSKSSIYNYINAGTFPKQISVGERSVRWLDLEVQEWIQNRINERNQMVA